MNGVNRHKESKGPLMTVRVASGAITLGAAWLAGDGEVGWAGSRATPRPATHPG